MTDRQQPVIDRLTALNDRKRQALARRHGAVGVLTAPVGATEQGHAQRVAESATTMRGKGYSVDVVTTAQEHIYAIQVKGPRVTEYAHEDACEILDECPPYTTLADYVLARYEQDVE